MADEGTKDMKRTLAYYWHPNSLVFQIGIGAILVGVIFAIDAEYALGRWVTVLHSIIGFDKTPAGLVSFGAGMVGLKSAIAGALGK
jgi:hypothetical protein